MRKILTITLFLLVLTACGAVPGMGPQAPSASATPITGIEGQVVIGPSCPVQSAQDPCPDQPYQATLQVLSLGGKQVAKFQTGADGRFLIALSPGTYVLHPDTPSGRAYPRSQEQTFTVVEGRCTQLMVTYDSGIR